MAKKEKSCWPAWWYDPDTGKGKIFHKEDDVPKGWTDDPHAYLEAEAPAPKAESPNKGLAKANGLTKKGIAAELDEAGIDYDKSLGVDDLAAFYLSLPDADEDELDDEE